MTLPSAPEIPSPTSPAPPGGVGEALTAAARGRASWSGLLKLSLVAVPVKAYPAAISSQETHFNQLHAGCGQRIRYEKHCPIHGKVDAGAIASGYAYARDQYLVLEEAELDKLRPAKDKALSLEYFLDPADIDPVLFSGRSLYLLPDGPAAQHPYVVLSQAMAQRRKWALGRVVLGGRRYLGLVRPTRRILTLHVLHYPAHLRASAAWEGELRLSATTDDEAKLAGLLIEAASPVAIPWADYRDDTADKLAALVEAKLQNRPLPEPAEEDATVLNLLDALKQSVAQVQQPVPTVPAAPGAGKKKRDPPEVRMIVDPFLPMLAVRSEPFDSGEFLFEVKWNGVRALAACDAGGWRLWGRELADYRDRYPELGFLGRLPPGTVLDGEVVLLRQGVPDLEAVLARHPLSQSRAIQHLSRTDPVTYVVFDALYAQGCCLFGEPLYKRRAALTEVVTELAEPRLVFSEGVVGPGSLFFERAVGQGHEGVVAKHLASTYVPGRRCAGWRKIKPARTLPCVIVGFVPGRHGFRRLFVAAPREGGLRYVASLHSGFTDSVRAQLAQLLGARTPYQPVVDCPSGAVGVEPDLYCQVRFLEWTHAGHLRGASFQRLLDAASQAVSVPGRRP